jgi:hypothetical protein
VNGAVCGKAGGFHDGFGDGGVGVHGMDEFGFGGFEVVCEDEFGEVFGDVFADQVGAEEGAVFGVEDEFDEAVGLSGGEGAAGGGEGEFADFELAALFAELSFGEADAGDLGVGVGAGGDEAVVDGVVGEAGDAFDAIDGFVVGDVGEVGVAEAGEGGVGGEVDGGAIADGKDVGEVGLEVGVCRRRG